MNPKYSTFEWWSICIWFLIWGLWSILVVIQKLYSQINIGLGIAGFILMFYCARKEESWFPNST